MHSRGTIRRSSTRSEGRTEQRHSEVRCASARGALLLWREVALERKPWCDGGMNEIKLDLTAWRTPQLGSSAMMSLQMPIHQLQMDADGPAMSRSPYPRSEPTPPQKEQRCASCEALSVRLALG